MGGILTPFCKKNSFDKNVCDNVIFLNPLLFQACAKVIPFIEKQVENIKRCLDGKNVTAVLMEFGIRFHRVIFDHLQQYTYNSLG